MRLFAMFAAFLGALLCIGAAGTGIYWGMVLKAAPGTWKEIHLDTAIACVFVSLVAHICSILVLKKHHK